MKEGWTYKKLGEVCDFEGGTQPPKSEWIKHPNDGYVRMLQIRDFTKSREFEIEYVKITKKLRLCNADDILIGRYGASVGKILTGLSGAYNVAIIKSIPDEKYISKDFIRRFFESTVFQNVLFKVCASRAAQAGFSKDDIIDTLIPIPPLSEQQRIVSRLDAVFAYIDALKANAEKQLAEARQLFQAELAECMRPKEGWEVKKLKEVAKYSIGLTYKPSDVCENGTIVLRSSNIQEDKLDLADIVRVSCPIKESLYVEKGDILMCSRNGSARLVGKVALIPETEERMTYGTFMMTIRSEFNLYLFNFFKSEDFRNQIKHGEANMINQITRYMLDDVIVNIPPLSAQHSIVSRLDALSANIKKLVEVQRKTLAECDALKQAMLREVFE